MKYIIECGGCGREITRYYLPEIVFCHDCGEAYVVDTWREVETRKYHRSEVTQACQ